MNMRRLVVASMLVAGTSALAPVASARVDVGVVIAPPEPRVEVVPAPRPGYVWAPGYYQWNGHRHNWHNGYWVRAQPGRHWVAHNWEQRGDHWYFHGGHWDRD